MKKHILTLTFSILLALPALAQQLTGIVTDALTGKALAGASIRISPTGQSLSTGTQGLFQIKLPKGSYSLTVAYVGYRETTLQLTLPKNDTLRIRLENDPTQLSDVTVQTGYQQISRERLTGSVVTLNSELLDRRVSTNILNRLEDLSPGLAFNRSGVQPGELPISIRGQSTLFGNSDPLIILNNFPYEGDLANINPNDVESISILKDASAASIWGARAGNGVIVITTKQGHKNQKTTASFSSRLTVAEQPDLYSATMSSADYIETEKRLFDLGFYRTTETSVNKAPLTPVVELLIAKRDGKLSASEADNRIEALKSYDIRQDYAKYLYRKPVSIQNALSLSGGTASSKYYLSAGWDRNLLSLQQNSYDRISVAANQSYFFFKDRLELNTKLGLNRRRSNTPNRGTSNLSISGMPGIYPYARLADDNGNPLMLENNLRLSYAQNPPTAGLLDWTFRPLEETAIADSYSEGRELRGDVGLNYTIIPGLKASLLYQYIYGTTLSHNLQSAQSYATRNLINTYSIRNSDGSISRPVPLGGILDESSTATATTSLRAQLTYQKDWGKKHSLSLLSGYELRDKGTALRSYRQYGYDAEHATAQLVNYQQNYSSQINPAQRTLRIPFGDSQDALTDRFLSYYANAAYTLDSRYNAYLSARLDQSNIFGVDTNQKGVPLWSVGAAWNIDRENFFKLDFVDALKLRMSYGYSGSVDKSLSAYTTARYSAASAGITGLPFADIENPPNPDLRWEKVGIFNIGLDFSLFKNRLSGSLDVYSKHAKDLLGSSPFPPSSGTTQFKGNYADSKGRGLDLALQSGNLVGTFSWQTNLNFSYSRDIVTNYKVNTTANNYVEQGINGSVPLEGKPIYGIYSFPWAGLDPQNGDPMGYLNGVISKNYALINSTTAPADLVFSGSSRPAIYGALRNTFSYRGFSLSANISYRLGYYFRKTSVGYANNQALGGHSDVALRWQHPGDELSTFVPSIPAATNAQRDAFYKGASILVSKGDHIRFQDINLAYDLGKSLSLRGISGLKVFLYIDNIGMLWKATKFDTDPDYGDILPSRSYSLGINLNL